FRSTRRLPRARPGVEWLEPRLAPAVLVVNSVGDGGDFNPGDGVAATTSKEGTLRAAIEEANANPGPDVIRFDLPANSGPILPLTPLPAIRGQVFIDGYSQNGSAPNA